MRSLLIIVDGLGYDQLTAHQPPGLTALGRRLGLSPVRSLLSFSSGIYCSIWSGLYPEEHGIWTEYYRGADERFRISAWLRGIPGKFLPRALAYLLLSGLSRLGWRGQEHEHFAIPVKLQPLFRKMDSDYRIFPPVPIHPRPDFSVRLENLGRAWDYQYCEFLDRSTEARVRTSADAVDTLIICFPEMDHAGHRLDPTGEEYRRCLLDFDQRLTVLLRSLDQAGLRFLLFLFSDHGMTRVTRSFDIWSYLERSGFRLGEEYLAFINSTVVPLWFGDDRRREIIDCLNRSGAGHVLTEAEKRQFHLRFPDNRFGDDCFLADEGVECVPNFINLARGKGRGMHGYNPRLSSTRAFFIGERQIRSKPRDILGIHAALEEIMLSRSRRGAAGKKERHVRP